MAILVMNQFRNTAVLLMILALIGLLAQRKPAKETLSGVLKVGIGFMIFNIGGGHVGTIAANFATLFQTAFGVQGTVLAVEPATALAMDVYGFEISMIMGLGFIFGLVIAKLTPLKSIFLTGQHYLFFAAVIGLIFISNGMPTWVTVIFGSLVLGFAGAGLPKLAQKYTDELTGNAGVALGHFNLIFYWFSGVIGSVIGGKNWQAKKEKAANRELPDFFSVFRDFVFSVAFFMIILFYIATIAAVLSGHMDVVQEMAGNDLWFLYPLIQGLQFAAGMSVLIYGVRQFIAELTAAFVAISEKYIPGSMPAVDVPVFFQYAPTMVPVGFITSFIGGLTATFAMDAMGSPVVLLPAAGIAFFSGGTMGVFGSIRGGLKGAIIASFLGGILLTALPLVLFPAFSELGITDAGFPQIDYNIIGILLDKILKLFS